MTSTLEAHIGTWRERMAAQPGTTTSHLDALTKQLTETAIALRTSGLTDDEAFLIAARRLDPSPRPVTELPFSSSAAAATPAIRPATSAAVEDLPAPPRTGVWPMLAFAGVAGLAVAGPVNAGLKASGGTGEALLLALVVMLAVAAAGAAYLWWAGRPTGTMPVALVGGTLAVVGALGALYPSMAPHHTRILFVLHAAIAVTVVVGAVYLGRRWRQVDAWMEWVRLVGEVIIYYTLIGMGGMVLMGLAGVLLALTGFNPSVLLTQWVWPLGVGGAVIVSLWLAQRKKSVVENIAPILSAIFTPLFVLLLAGFLVALATTGGLINPNRELLILVDLLLAVVFGLVLFSVSARPATAPRGLFDGLQLALIALALVVDVIVLVAIGTRIAEFGWTPNKVAALGENVVLAVNLAWSGWLLVGFLRGRRPISDLVTWQCRYLFVLGAWAAAVLIGFGPLFHFA